MFIEFIQQDGKRAQVKCSTNIKHGWKTAWYKMNQTKKCTFVTILGEQYKVPSDLKSFFG